MGRRRFATSSTRKIEVATVAVMKYYLLIFKILRFADLARKSSQGDLFSDLGDFPAVAYLVALLSACFLLLRLYWICKMWVKNTKLDQYKKSYM